MINTGPNLLDVRNSIRKRAGFILATTLIAIIGGTIFYAFAPVKYLAKTEFIVRNPMYGDRTVIYNSDNRLYDYFATDDDIDKVMLLSRTDIVQEAVIRNMQLAKAYKKDTTDLKQYLQLQKTFNSNLSVVRTEYKDVLLSYEDTDPKRAVAVANECVGVLNNEFSNYFREMRKEMYGSVVEKIHDQDSSINALTDSLIGLRDQYGIYASRYNLMLGSMKEKTNEKYGRGIEQIQNLESMRDALVSDRAGQITLINHYKTGLNGDRLPLIKVVTPAKVVHFPGLLSGLLVIAVCGATALFFSILVALISDSNYLKSSITLNQ